MLQSPISRSYSKYRYELDSKPISTSDHIHAFPVGFVHFGTGVYFHKLKSSLAHIPAHTHTHTKNSRHLGELADRISRVRYTLMELASWNLYCNDFIWCQNTWPRIV